MRKLLLLIPAMLFVFLLAGCRSDDRRSGYYSDQGSYNYYYAPDGYHYRYYYDRDHHRYYYYGRDNRWHYYNRDSDRRKGDEFRHEEKDRHHDRDDD